MRAVLAYCSLTFMSLSLSLDTAAAVLWLVTLASQGWREMGGEARAERLTRGPGTAG